MVAIYGVDSVGHGEAEQGAKWNGQDVQRLRCCKALDAMLCPPQPFNSIEL